MGFIDDLKLEGLLAPMTVLDRKVVRPDSDTAHRLGISPRARVVRFRWVRSIDRSTVAYGIDDVTEELGRRITLADVQSRTSLVDTFEHAGVWPAENIQTLTPVLASADVARRLHVDVGSPVAQIDGVGLDRDGSPFEAYRLWLSPGYRMQQRFIRVTNPVTP
jgi:DNA-binding GntR family transcriptional regulator